MLMLFGFLYKQGAVPLGAAPCISMRRVVNYYLITTRCPFMM